MGAQCRNDDSAQATISSSRAPEGANDLLHYYLALQQDQSERLVHVCCRIHPLIRDSASVTKVPFHVRWIRDISCNFTNNLEASTILACSFLAVLGIIIWDVTRILDNKFTPDDYVSLSLVLVALGFMLKGPALYLYSVCQELMFPSSPQQAYGGTDAWNPFTEEHPNPCAEKSPFKDCRIRTSILAVAPVHVNDEMYKRSRKMKSKHVKKLFESEDSPQVFHTHLQNDCGHYAIRESRGHHWWMQESALLRTPVRSSQPKTGEIDEIMSINAVAQMLEPDVAAVYNDYVRSGDLRVAARRVMNSNLPGYEWLHTWHNCWEDDDVPVNAQACQCSYGDSRQDCNCCVHRRERKIREDKKQVKELLMGCKDSELDPTRWGPLLRNLEMPICVLNKNGEGALLMSQELLSTILPRYGHKTTVDEVAYLSAKAAEGSYRYFRPKAYVFWALSVSLIKSTVAIAATIDASENVILMLLGVLTLSFAVSRLAFGFDAETWATGRVQEGCIIESAKGCKVTTAILSKWNENIREECSHKLGFSNGSNATTWQNRAVDYRTYMRTGGLILSTDSAETGLAIFPGSNNLRVRSMKFYENIFHTEDEPVKENFVFKAKHIVSRSHCRVCMESFSAPVVSDIRVES